MNKKSYRIIFSRAKNMFVVVAENVKSQIKSSGQTSSSNQSPKVEAAFEQSWQVKSLVTALSLFMAFSPAYANIQVDLSVPNSQQAVIGVGKNQLGDNVPIVNIQTPINGISHNIFSQFDVLNPGVVLNNSRGGAPSTIVGQAAENPFLNTGEARLILNEVNSTAASKLQGNLEVAGQRADIIIANPSGIDVQGGGFINANKAILTTGKPQFNADGSIQQFVVNQGKVSINGSGNNLGLGGNNNSAEYVDIYARALEVNAQLQANQDINVVTGANTISEDLTSIESNTSGASNTQLAIDVKQLGGMYANNIYLIGNEKGLGVNNAGTLQAVKNLVVTSSGSIVNSGTMTTSDKKTGLVSVTTTGTGADADITVKGSINSYGMVNIDSANDLNLKEKDITVNFDAGAANSAALVVNAKGKIDLAAGTMIDNLSASGDLYIDAKNISLSENVHLRSNRGSMWVNTTENLTANNQSRFTALVDLNINANKELKMEGNALWATEGSINLQSMASTANPLQLNGVLIFTGENLNINGVNDVLLNNLNFYLVNDMARVKNINVASSQNIVWDNQAKPLAKISGKVLLDAKQKLDLSNTAADDIVRAIAAIAGYDVNTAARAADIAIENNSLVKLVTTTGKLLVKAAEIYGDLKKVSKNKPIDVKEFTKQLKDQGASELIGIADDLITVFGPASSPFDRALAAFDLVVGTDLKPGKGESLKLAKSEIDKLKVDQVYTQKILQIKRDVITRNRLEGKAFEVSAAGKLGVKRNTDRVMLSVKTEKDGDINIIPDAFGEGKTLIEFKNVKYLSDTAQLRGYAATKQPITLVVNMKTDVSRTVREAVEKSGGRIHRFDSNTQTIHPY